MPHVEHQFLPDEYYSAKDIDRLLATLEKRIEAREVMCTKIAAEFLGISTSKLYRMDNIPSHRIPGLSGKVFLRSELLAFIKKC